MNCRLDLEYEYSRDGDDFGWLVAKIVTPSFTGRNGMWVQWQDIDEFASSLSQYPIRPSDPVVVDWGFSKQGTHTSITKIAAEPAGLTGGLVITVSLANDHEPANRCSVRFETEYPALGNFVAELHHMMRERTGGAALIGSTNVR
jgi:hypothetical protein